MGDNVMPSSLPDRITANFGRGERSYIHSASADVVHAEIGPKDLPPDDYVVIAVINKAGFTTYCPMIAYQARRFAATILAMADECDGGVVKQ